MKKLLFLLLMVSSLFSKDIYHITFGNITLGEIENFESIKKGYLVAKPTNSLLKLFFDYDNFIVYEKNKKPKVAGKNKEKEDRYLILKLVNELRILQPRYRIIEDRKTKVDIQCVNKECTYTRYHKIRKEKSKGYINFTKDNKLKIICDEESSICIKKG